MDLVLMWMILIAVVTCVACSLCGVLLVVKREAFFSEALSHSVLPGIVIAFICFQSRYSVLLIVAAAVSGLLMVGIVKFLTYRNTIRYDAALAIAFSGLFSIGVIAASLNLRNTHFHASCIVDGNLALSAIDPCYWGTIYLGPKAFVSMTICLALVTGFIVLFYKELKLMAFDRTSSILLGFRPDLIHLAWLSVVSVTAVCAFEAAGTILVVAIMIAPAATANLISNRLNLVFLLSGILAATSAVIGVFIGDYLNISPTSPIASISGVIFLLLVLFLPRRGVIANLFARSNLRLATRKEDSYSI